MPSAVHKRGPATPEMNLTPLIDVVFQLMIFFMLVNNFVAGEVVEMIVPTLDEPQTREMSEADGIVVSVAPQLYTPASRASNPLAFVGEARVVQVGLREFAPDDLEGIAAALASAQANNPTIEVLLRADSALHYEEIQPVMAAIAHAGIKTVHLVASMPEQGPVAGSPPSVGGE